MGLVQVIAVSIAFLVSFSCCYGDDNRNISKCKDSNGVWHYGDFAGDNCAPDSDVTEMNQQGVRVKVNEAKPDARDSASLSEVSRKKQEQQRDKERARDRDNRLLTMYESVDDLIVTRDERIKYVSGIITINQEFLGQLHKQHSSLTEQYGRNPSKRLEQELQSTEQSMELYERVIADRLHQKNEIMQQFDKDIERYKHLVLLQQAKDRAQAGY